MYEKDKNASRFVFKHNSYHQDEPLFVDTFKEVI